MWTFHNNNGNVIILLIWTLFCVPFVIKAQQQQSQSTDNVSETFDGQQQIAEQQQQQLQPQQVQLQQQQQQILQQPCDRTRRVFTDTYGEISDGPAGSNYTQVRTAKNYYIFRIISQFVISFFFRILIVNG